MINASFCRQDGQLSVHFSGHANYAARNDIVCASASAIFYALYGYLLNTCRDALSDVSVESGDARLTFPARQDTEPAFRLAYIGMYQLSETYPLNVKCKMQK